MYDTTSLYIHVHRRLCRLEVSGGVSEKRYLADGGFAQVEEKETTRCFLCFVLCGGQMSLLRQHTTWKIRHPGLL